MTIIQLISRYDYHSAMTLSNPIVFEPYWRLDRCRFFAILVFLRNNRFCRSSNTKTVPLKTQRFFSVDIRVRKIHPERNFISKFWKASLPRF